MFYGTQEFCPPEVLEGKSYNGPEADCWALGVLLYTLVFKQPPTTIDETTYEVSLLEIKESNEVSGSQYLIRRLMDKNFLTRMRVSEAMADEWVKGKLFKLS